jgi:hypothetical protein
LAFRSRSRAGDPNFEPNDYLESFAGHIESGQFHLICDTNVYLNAREAIGVEPDGRLRPVFGQVAESPDVAVLRATALAGIESRFIIALAVKNELFSLMRDGYSERPVGLGDAPRTALALRGLVNLHPIGRAFMGTTTHEESLPNPPLSNAERNDRAIWGQAKACNGILVTSDSDLIDAVRMVADACSALRPSELYAVSVAFSEK